MRQTININQGWLFSKEALDIKHNKAKMETINIPHTWNGIDGQDGGNDYYRGTCYYVKNLGHLEVLPNQEIYLEFQGVNSSAKVFLNEKELCVHHGGYSTFRVNITHALGENNTLLVEVDNQNNEYVYPQKADFTFYGGIYRDVHVIIVDQTHFDLDYYGGSGIKITPNVNENDAHVHIESFITGDFEQVKVSLFDQSDTLVAEGYGKELDLEIKNVHLWDGLNDPYMYYAKAELIKNQKIVDHVEISFACRTFYIDAEKGFFLNGKSYPLRGVSRHQDYPKIGNALTYEEHNQDMALILEVGANTIRLAHYQHDQYFYDLCDQKGMIVWAEIPYITQHMPTARENTITQMKELITQNYHHPSIIVWGLSNEISVRGYSDDLYDNHIILNDLCHQMDPTRLTTMAAVTILNMDSPLVKVPDVVGYNHYFGWYSGNAEMNGIWFDEFHEKYPQIPIAITEYGAEAVMDWQTANPKIGDYTEQYQAVFHESLCEQIFDRPYLWASYVWNMFDFAADARQEGGENGMNHKGLVTFDRQIKKDAFYIYKAYLSKDPFVYITSRRYVKRHEDVSEIKVYSNQDEVSLYHNDVLVETQKGSRIFKFNVKLQETNTFKAISGACTDTIAVEKVSDIEQGYILKQTAVINWFENADYEIERKDGYFSIFDKMSDVQKHPEGAKVLSRLSSKVMESMGLGDMMPTSREETDLGDGIKEMMAKMTIQDSIRMTGKNLSIDFILEINQQLNLIKK